MPSCHSTNDVMHELLQSDRSIEEGLLVITNNQTAGRGQRGNVWESEANKNITCSILFKPSFLSLTSLFDLNIIVSLSIVSTLKMFHNNQNIKIKWPNDIFINNNKIGGILIENTLKGSTIQNSIIGIGLNINQEIFNTSIATSLKNLTGIDFDLSDIIKLLIEKLESCYLRLKSGERESLWNLYQQNLYRLHEMHKFSLNGFDVYGEIMGISNSGKLIMKIDNEIKNFGFKEIIFT